jgi:hypothetical protein
VDTVFSGAFSVSFSFFVVLSTVLAAEPIPLNDGVLAMMPLFRSVEIVLCYLWSSKMNLDGLWIVPHGAVTEYERKRFFFALDAATYIFLASSL